VSTLATICALYVGRTVIEAYVKRNEQQSFPFALAQKEWMQRAVLHNQQRVPRARLSTH
jgi:hypothetical protein